MNILLERGASKYADLSQLTSVITYNCTYNLKYDFYYARNAPSLSYIRSDICFVIQILTMAFITICYIFKIRLHSNKKKRGARLLLKISLVFVTMGLYFLRYKWPKSPLYVFTMLLFYIFHYKLVKRTFVRLFKILERVYQILVLEMVIILLTCCILRIATYDYGDSYRDAPYFYSYNYESFSSILGTLLFLQTVNNFPELIISEATSTHFFVVYFIICVHAFIVLFVIHAMVLGHINEEYMRLYEKELNEDLEERNTVVLALEIVSGKRDIDEKVLQDLVLEDIR